MILRSTIIKTYLQANIRKLQSLSFNVVTGHMSIIGPKKNYPNLYEKHVIGHVWLGYRESIRKNGRSCLKVSDNIDVNSGQNLIISHMGTAHNNYILLDVDNKDNSIKKFNTLKDEHPEWFDTYCELTINKGYHYVYCLSDDQDTEVSKYGNGKFTSTKLQLMFGCFIDIMYNEGAMYSACMVNYRDKEFKSVITNAITPTIMPDNIFEEYIKCLKISRRTLAKSNPKKVSNDPKEHSTTEIKNISEAELRFYLDSLNDTRFTSYADWRLIGAVIHYHGFDISIFHEYSKKADFEENNCYDAVGVDNEWSKFKINHRTPFTIDSLKGWALNDCPRIINNNKYYKEPSEKMVKRLLTHFCYKGSKDVYTAQLFYNYQNNKDRYIYDGEDVITGKSCWYYRNDFGIYIRDSGCLQLEKDLNTIFNLIKIRHGELLNELTEEDSDQLKELNRIFDKNENYFTRAPQKKNIILELRLLYHIPEISIKFNTNRNLLGFNNGIFNLKNQQFYPHGIQGEYITMTTGYDYKKTYVSKREEITRLLRQIFPIDGVFEFMLYKMSKCLRGINDDQDFVILVGGGSNGKTTFTEMIDSVLGEYSQPISLNYFTHKNKDEDANAADPTLVTKMCSRVCVGSEFKEGATMSTHKIKGITGNDKMTCRQLFGLNVHFRCYFQLFMVMNEIPEVIDVTYGWVRRFRVVKMHNLFVDVVQASNHILKDTTLSDKIQTDDWKLSLFHLLLEIMHSPKVFVPEIVLKDSREQLFKSDYILMFITEKLVTIKDTLKSAIKVTENDVISSSALYAEYCQFFPSTGAAKSKKKTIISFSAYMVSNGFKKDLHGPLRKMHYFGLKYRSEYDKPVEPIDKNFTFTEADNEYPTIERREDE